MATWKMVIADPEKRVCYPLEVERSKALGLIGKKIGDTFNGEMIGLPGYVLQITGGTDKDGFPMHPHVHGPGKKRILLSGPPCFYPKHKGQRKRKTVRGNVISEDIVQVNCKIVKKGEKPVEELIPIKKKVEEKKEEEAPKRKEEVKEEKPEKKETKAEEKPSEEAKPKEEKKGVEEREEKTKEETKTQEEKREEKVKEETKPEEKEKPSTESKEVVK